MKFVRICKIKSVTNILHKNVTLVNIVFYTHVVFK